MLELLSPAECWSSDWDGFSNITQSLITKHRYGKILEEEVSCSILGFYCASNCSIEIVTLAKSS